MSQKDHPHLKQTKEKKKKRKRKKKPGKQTPKIRVLRKNNFMCIKCSKFFFILFRFFFFSFFLFLFCFLFDFPFPLLICSLFFNFFYLFFLLFFINAKGFKAKSIKVEKKNTKKEREKLKKTWVLKGFFCFLWGCS